MSASATQGGHKRNPVCQ